MRLQAQSRLSFSLHVAAGRHDGRLRRPRPRRPPRIHFGYDDAHHAQYTSALPLPQLCSRRALIERAPRVTIQVVGLLDPPSRLGGVAGRGVAGKRAGARRLAGYCGIRVRAFTTRKFPSFYHLRSLQTCVA